MSFRNLSVGDTREERGRRLHVHVLSTYHLYYYHLWYVVATTFVAALPSPSLNAIIAAAPAAPAAAPLARKNEGRGCGILPSFEYFILLGYFNFTLFHNMKFCSSQTRQVLSTCCSNEWLVSGRSTSSHTAMKRDGNGWLVVVCAFHGAAGTHSILYFWYYCCCIYWLTVHSALEAAACLLTVVVVFGHRPSAHSCFDHHITYQATSCVWWCWVGCWVFRLRRGRRRSRTTTNSSRGWRERGFDR